MAYILSKSDIGRNKCVESSVTERRIVRFSEIWQMDAIMVIGNGEMVKVHFHSNPTWQISPKLRPNWHLNLITQSPSPVPQY